MTKSAASVPFFQPEDEFTRVLKGRVSNYFKEKNLSTHCNTEMVLKTVFYLALFAGLYVYLLIGGLSTLGLLALSMVIGVNLGLIGFNIGHDAIHGSYSSNPKWNIALGHSFSMIGAYPSNWKFTHNVVHHTYTNIPGSDGDIQPHFLLKYHENASHRWYHRYQRFYFVFLYSVFTLEWVTVRDLKQLMKTNHLEIRKTRTPKIEFVKLAFIKFIYFGLFLGLPMVFLPLAWWQVVLGFFAMHLALGLTLTFVFQVGHLVDGVPSVPVPENAGTNDSFFVHQLKTTANFRSRDWLASWITGGLNCQIEHHLFPKICSTHYRHLAPIVEATAHEFGLPYNDFGTYSSALKAHVRLLKLMGDRNVTEQNLAGAEPALT